LFKNGFTVVRQAIDIPAPGVYRWDEVPSAIHGTFFIESDLNIEIRTTQRLVTLPFPMTTAPATVTEQQKFLGQSTSNWVNPSQIASVKITKVMNVRVTYSEQLKDYEQNVIQSFRGSRFIKRECVLAITLTRTYYMFVQVFVLMELFIRSEMQYR
jgi:hypothetical protein